ncbi:MAG: MBL fold metallo-hydrolase [Pseudomonadota bacterium]
MSSSDFWRKFSRRTFIAHMTVTVLALLTACGHKVRASVSMPKHHQPDGTFRNRYAQRDGSFFDFLKWQWDAPERKPIAFELSANDPAYLARNRQDPTLTWIGHATFLLQYSGLNILTDPHLSARASPFTFVGPRRMTPPGLALEQLPPIDVVVISHSHYDHLDRTTVRVLAQQESPPHFFVPLRLADWCRRQGVKTVTELDWFESVSHGDWTFHAVPVQHWSNRTMFDRNKTLWAGWVIERQGFRFFFAGDSGYSKDFQDIRARYGDMDLAALPIGAYAPRWIMKKQHANPAEAVQIHQDLGARWSVGMHWGTFQLTDELPDEPPKKLAQARTQAGIKPDRFFVMGHGETRKLDFL